MRPAAASRTSASSSSPAGPPPRSPNGSSSLHTRFRTTSSPSSTRSGRGTTTSSSPRSTADARRLRCVVAALLTDLHNTCCPMDNGCSLPVVSSRRELLLDAAIQVLGERGVRAVTHRAVDAEAGVGAGSTANYFATREALFNAIVERFAQRERANFEEIAARVCPTSPAELGRALGELARGSAGPERALTLSRYALLVESANNPVLREQMALTGARVSSWFATWLRLIGSSDPDHHMHLVGNYLTGLVLHQLAIPDPQFDPTDKVISLLESLVGPD